MSSKLRSYSLKGRLTLFLMLVIGIPLLAGCLALVFIVPRLLRANFDEGLETRARALVSLTLIVDGDVEFEFSDQFIPEFEDEDDPYYFELWVDGEEIERSRSFFPERGVRLPDLPMQQILADEPRLFDLTLPDGRTGRMARIDFVPEATEPDEPEDIPGEEEYEVDEEPLSPIVAQADGEHSIATVLVAGGTEDLGALIFRFRVLSLTGTAGLLLLLALGVHAALNLGLRPLRGVIDQVSDIDVESLDNRVEAVRAPAELTPLLEQFNQLLDRVESAFRRERQLTADMAHELKTPIAELRSLGEVGANWPEDREAVVDFFADARDIAKQMDRVVCHLLALARHDAGRHVVESEVLPLGRHVDFAMRPYLEKAEARGLTLENDIPLDLAVVSDPGKLELILTNLISNAVSYSREGTRIRIEAFPDGDTVCLSVQNQTENLEPGDLGVMFDRFWRKDEARTGGKSAGLGLALVRAFCGLLGIREEAHLDTNGTLVIRLRIPAARDLRETLPRSAAS